MVALPDGAVDAFVSRFEGAFRVDRDMVQESIDRGASSGGRVELAYLRKWALELDLTELLERALTEAGILNEPAP